MFIAVLSFISIGAFILSRFAGEKAKRVLVTHNITVNEERIAVLGLYKGLALRLRCSEEKNMIKVFVTDAREQEVQLGEYDSYIEYDILKKKKIHAFIYSIHVDIVVLEVKLYDAL